MYDTPGPGSALNSPWAVFSALSFSICSPRLVVTAQEIRVDDCGGVHVAERGFIPAAPP